MAKKKNRNKDFDSWLESINSNTYIPQMAQNAPNNANLYGFGSWMGNMFSKPFDAISRRRSAKEFEAYENEHPIDGVSNGTGTLNMQPSGQTWGNTNGPSIQMTQTEYNSNPTGSNEFNNDLSLNNPYFSSGNRESRKAARDLRIEALNERTDNGEGFLGRMNTNSGFNMGALPGLAAETARVWSDPNSTKLDKVGNLFGIANISKLYSADTEKGDAKINEMTGRLNDFKQNNIQDAWDTLGAGQALKLNKGPNQIKLMDLNSLGVKDFKRKGMLGLTLGAMGQGAASGGSVGGAWGAAGGALSGLFAGIGGMFGRRRRAKKAYNAWRDSINYLNNNARMLNAQAQNEWAASNANAIKNGVEQEKINDMANFRAYGGNLFDDGGSFDKDPLDEIPNGIWSTVNNSTNYVPTSDESTLTPAEQQKILDDWEEWKKEHPKLYLAGNITPFVGTEFSKYDYLSEPSFSNALSLAMSGTGDAALFMPAFVNRAYQGLKDWKVMNKLVRNPDRIAASFIGRIDDANDVDNYYNENIDIQPTYESSYIPRQREVVPEYEGYMLPEVVVEGNKKALGGNLFEDGGGLGDDYIYEGRMLPEAIVEAESMPWYEKWYNKGKRNLIDPISNRAAYAYNYFRHNLFDVDDPAFFKNLSDKNVQRVTEDNQNGIDYILGNDFQEENQNDIRRKADFLNTSDTLLGDRKIPLSAISTYYGIEDGKLKAGTLDDFDDNTTVVPNRAKNIGKIKEYHPVSEEYKHNKFFRKGAEKLAEMVDDERVVTKIFDRYFKQHPEKEKYLKQQIKDWYDVDNPTKLDLIQAAYDWDYDNMAKDPILKDYLNLSNNLWDYAYAVDEKPGFVVTENNDTIPNYQFNEEPKGMFADENGHSVFFSGKSEDNVKQINDFLSKYPSYPVMLDNGRYFNYTNNNNINEYTGGFMDPQKGYIIGTEKALGGNLDMNGLSPNLIDLQNQSLANQKYKYNNQLQPLGFTGGPGDKEPNPGFPRFSLGGMLNRFDFGGAMNGMDLPTGMQSYDAGGTHEENPNGGVQVGVDQQGNPNLVEEGEFRWGDYVFSDRILVDEDILSLYNAELNPNRSTKRKARKGKLTYADLAKKYADKNKELVNDPIGKSTIDKYMENLSHAEEDQKMRAEEEKADRDYNNALANQTQGNPMYGSMKYNGMGNANAGLNEGNAAMGGMDNSGLSNVNRSGNEMLHAFGGNLYEGGGPILTMGKDGLYHYKGDDGRDYTLSPNEVEIVNGVPTPAQNTSLLGMRDADGNIVTVNPQTGQMSNGTVIDPSTLDVNQTGYNYGQSISQPVVRPNTYGIGLDGKLMFDNVQIPTDYDKPRGARAKQITGYADGPIIGNPNVNQTPRYMNNGANAWMYFFNDNSSFAPSNHVSPYVTRHLDGEHWSAGTGFDKGNNNPQPTPVPTPTPTPTPTPQPTPNPPAKEGPNTNTGGGNSNTGNDGIPNPPDTGNNGGNNSGMRTNIDVTGNPGNLNAQYAAGNPWQSTPYQEWTRFDVMANGLPWVNSDAMGHTNWKYKIDNVPPDRMEALGRTGLALRNADHSGIFRSPDLMDVERQNNASQSLLANALRGISNVGGGNRGFVGAQSAAQNYNAQMGIGNNYATTNAYNADQKLKADEFNKQTEQFNANVNNQTEADNQRAKQFAKTYEMTGLQNANAERLHERNYKDAVDRVAAADRANNVTNMWDNALNFMANEAKMNHEYNMFNSDATQQYYWDKNKRQFIFKDDPNNPMIRMNNILRRENMGALSANSQKLLNSYIQQYGNNVPQELLDGLVKIEKQEQQRLAQKKEDDLKAGYRDLENEYDMLLSDYARRMNTKAEDGTTPKFANYTQDEYQIFDDLRNKPKLDEAGNPIYDEDYYSRLRMRANMMRNMMYGANSYYNNVTAYGGKICTKKKKQHYYMDV